MVEGNCAKDWILLFIQSASEEMKFWLNLIGVDFLRFRINMLTPNFLIISKR